MKNDHSISNVLTRRRMLARLGLAAGAAYVAPAMIGLNAARASGTSGGSGGGSGASRGGSSGASRGGSSAPSRGVNSGPSRGRRRRNGDDMSALLRRLMPGQ